MILKKKTNKEYHLNGELKYIDTKCTIAPLFKNLFPNLRVSPNGDLWCRTGLCAKYYDNGVMAWGLNYDEYGNVEKSEIQRRKDGSTVQY